MLAALYVNFQQGRSGVRTDTSDLMPWDFLRQFEVQKRDWLRKQTRAELEAKVKAVYEELPEELQWSLNAPMVRDVETVDGIDTIIMRVDYDALLLMVEAMNVLIGIMIDDEELALILLMCEP